MTAVLDPKAELDQLLEMERVLSSPADYALHFSPEGSWTAFPHLRLISDEIVGMVEDDTCDVLLVEVPVGHGKSELCSKWTPAWHLSAYPDAPVLLTSYEDDFAAQWGRKTRDVIEEHGGYFGLEVDRRSSSASRWNLLGHSGRMQTAGAGGPLTGKGFGPRGLGIIDDPIKGPEDVANPLLRDKLDQWFEQVWLTRRRSTGKTLIVMSRWHFDDLVGRLKKDPRKLRVRSVRLPAEAEDDDPLGRAPGELLCPALYDERAAETDKLTSAWPSLYQQRPMAAEGAMFSAGSFRRFDIDETGTGGERRTVYSLRTESGTKVWSAEECGRFGTVDLAVSTKTSADWTVVLSCAVTPDSELLCVGLTRTRVESHRHVDLVADAIARHKLGWAGVESVTFGLSLIQAAKRKGLPVRRLKADKDKVSRARPAQAMVENGQVYVPAGAEWVDEFIRECSEFPVGRHDDQVDCLAYACSEVAQGYVRARRRREVPTHETYDERVWRRSRERLDGKTKRQHPVLGRLR